MSAKMFWQIVLLMVIGALIAGTLKCAIMKCHKFGSFKCKSPEMKMQ